ncbi:hypothetical protein M1O19_01095 [Dehalococcoidia bacterium]|nr:hypothetical protein [Dehalococcoidia bacterium]MCL0094176.1 hypothetical protein [Dehalococcoidia bacterium]MCL0097120.1 hypothetical protein [Dehalococcoidia bacterium]
MIIENIVVKPYEKSIFPGLSFDTEIVYTRYDQAIVGIHGWLETGDQKIVAEIREEVSADEKFGEEIAARGSSFDGSFETAVYKTTLVTLLDRRAMTHIEKIRMEDRKGDVRLILNVKVKTIDSRAVISHVHEIEPTKIGLSRDEVDIEVAGGGRALNWNMLIYAHESRFDSPRDNKWILSGKGRPVFLAVSEQGLRKETSISSSDWIHDYAPKLGLGEYFIVEIPKGMQIVQQAWGYVESAEECFRRWDTKGVYANCRETGSLLDRTIKNKFRKDSFIYGERWGRTYKRFKNLSFEEFASLNLHLEDIKKSQKYSPEDVKIGKADAEHILIVTKGLIKYAEELLQEGG